MKKLSNVELSELIYMSSAMLDQLERFKHVSDLAPKSITEPLIRYNEKLNAEFDRRETEATS